MVALTLVALAVQVASAEPLDYETRRIAKRLQCPVCESVTVADSPSELAGQMRAVIRRKLEQGESEQEILAYFVERYGEGALVEPPRHGLGLALWVAPGIALAAGAGLLAVLFRHWSRRDSLLGQRGNRAFTPQNGTAARRADDAYAERARRELETFGQEP